MKKTELRLPANIPSLEEFASKYPHYRNFAEGEGQSLFQMLLTPTYLNSAKEATRLGLPAVSAVAEDTYQAVLKDTSPKRKGYLKQFIGAVICTLMEANGYQKTGKKKSVGHPAYSKGEFYQEIDSIS